MDTQQPVSKMFKLYLERSNLRAASIDIKARACRFFIQWFGDLSICEVKKTMADDYRTMLRRGRTATSVNSYLNNFRPFWAWLANRGYLRTNPFALIGPIRVDEQPERETFTPRELGAMMMVADDLWKIRIAFGLQGGRRGEVLAIQVCDVHLEDEPAHVLLGAKSGNGQTLPWGTKGRRLRLLALPERMGFDGILIPLRQLVASRCRGRDPEIYLCLREERRKILLERHRAGILTHGDLRDPDGNFPRQFRALQRRAGITRPRRFHELRAAFATHMIDSVGLSRAAELMGHASVEQTRKYDRTKRMALVAEAAKVTENTYVTNVS